jgi:phosphate transport system substrate-binding protein
VFVVHPANPVTKLTLEQIADIHTGKITNWKQVGGKDMPITVYSDAVTGGTRAMIKKLVMGGEEYAASVRSLTSVSRVPQVVAKDESGVGGVGRGFTTGVAVKLVQSNKIERPLGFVTLGDPSAKVKQVIEAFKVTTAKK